MNSRQALRGVSPWSACLFLLLALLTGCAGPGEPADLVIVNGKEPESLDPATVVGQPDGRVVQTLFEGLTRFNHITAAAEPGLAERWEISPDGRIYTFHLRANARWSTGEPITAEDFVYSWGRVLQPDTAGDYAGNLYYIKGAEEFNAGRNTDPDSVGVHALDERTLRVELNNPTVFFLELCAFQTQTVAPRQAIEKYGDHWLLAPPVPCSGAYELVSWRLNDRIRVRKNPHYWDAANTRSEVVDFLPVALPSTALNLFETREVDVVWDKDLIPTELMDVLRPRPDFHTFSYLATYFIRFNTTRKPFDDPRVRKAFSMAVDRERITGRVTRGGEKTANHLVPPGLPGYESPPGLAHDPEAARKLLAEAGYPGGAGFPRITYHFNTGRDHEKIGVELQEMWRRELAVEIELKAVEWKVWLRDQSEKDYDISRSSWVGDYTDPNTFLDMFMADNPNNRTGWKNSRYDELIRRANTLADAKARAALLNEAETILIAKEAPIAPLYIYSGFNLWHPAEIEGIFNNLRDEHPTRTIRRLTPRRR